MDSPELLLGVPLLALGAAGALVALAALSGPARLRAWMREPMGTQGAPAPQPPEAAAAGRRGHPSPREYVGIGLALAAVTAVEVAAYYVGALKDVLVPILLLLSATKFSLVVLWFMHLRFDSRLLSGLFLGALMTAVALFVVVLATFGASLV